MRRYATLEEVAAHAGGLPLRPGRAARLIALSGIDGAGKGYVAGQLAHRLEASGHRVALLNVDGWLNLPPMRFAPPGADPGRHFYEHALRLDEMFESLVLPLARTGTVDLTMDYTEETAHSYRRHRFRFDGITHVMLEGIFLFKRALRPQADLAVWVSCSFETALERALARAQEGLPPEAARAAYQTIYFPAERIHFELDAPEDSADLRVLNDPRLAPQAAGR